LCFKSEKLTGEEKKREEEEEKRGKDKGKRRELEKISLKVRLCINECSLSFKLLF
jgi:hypothetical protein